MKRLLIVLCALMFVPLCQGWAQPSPLSLPSFVYPYNRDFLGGGARALGMGGAFLGLSDDETAPSWNPAGLYNGLNEYEQPVVAIGWGSYMGNVDYSHTGLLGRQSSSLSKDFSGVTLASIVAPVRIKGHPFVGGITLNRLDDELSGSSFRYDTTVTYTAAGGPQPYRVRFSNEFHSGVNAINFAFGTRLYDRLSMGASVGIYTGNATYTNDLTVIQDGVPVGFSGQTVQLTNDSLTVDSIGYSGVFFTLGFRYIGDNYSAGLIIRPPHKLKEDDDRQFGTSRYINGLITTEGTETYYFDNNLVEIDEPMVIGGGFAYNATEKLILAADAEYRAFASGKIRVRDSLKLNPGDKDTEFFTTLDPNWNNVFAFRLGGEYMWDVGKTLVPMVPLRAGFGWTQLPEPNIVDSTGTTSTASKTTFSLGSGIHCGQVHLDVAFSTWTYSAEFRSQLIAGSDFGYTSLSKLDNSDHRWTVSFTGFF